MTCLPATGRTMPGGPATPATRGGLFLSRRDRAVFYNTGKSTTVRQFVYSLIAVICLEYIVVGVVIYFLVPGGWPLLPAAALLFCLLIFITYGFAGILRSAHLVSGDLLFLRLGRWFGCRLPLALIASVESCSLSSPPKPNMIGLRVPDKGRPFTARRALSIFVEFS